MRMLQFSRSKQSTMVFKRLARRASWLPWRQSEVAVQGEQGVHLCDRGVMIQHLVNKHELSRGRIWSCSSESAHEYNGSDCQAHPSRGHTIAQHRTSLTGARPGPGKWR